MTTIGARLAFAHHFNEEARGFIELAQRTAINTPGEISLKFMEILSIRTRQCNDIVGMMMQDEYAAEAEETFSYIINFTEESDEYEKMRAALGGKNRVADALLAFEDYRIESREFVNAHKEQLADDFQENYREELERQALNALSEMTGVPVEDLTIVASMEVKFDGDK